MSDEKIAQSVVDSDANKSPKSLDDKVLAYAKRKAQSNRSVEKTISLPPIYSGVAGLAVLVMAVLLFPQMQQFELESDNNQSVAAAPKVEVPSNVKPRQAKPQSGVHRVSSLTARAKKKASYAEMHSDTAQLDSMQLDSMPLDSMPLDSMPLDSEQLESMQSEHEASYSESPVISAASIMAKSIENGEANQAPQLPTRAKSIAESEYSIEEIVVNDDVSSVNAELVKKNLKTLVELKKLFQYDELKAEAQYQLFRKTEQGLPESFPALFNLIDEMTNDEKVKKGNKEKTKNGK